ncbi:hypothetical protein GYMLUDRAFT_197778 [Collybiopsis luxurians FD-317 M1]|uniref:L-aminoadipate-semialdehyde dehydrogenase n=1 Tax=Collybiopsis luxurians FD-317 M1 TaxID=944289 RepID=A0A0D0CK56_9AGAR|nr:hypothetical protein GYMLUDRAFT_197778 [Collybiopsis luxurians FD-317 M1]
MAFVRPLLNLGYLPDDPQGVNGLPELIEFNAKHNPDHIFCLQSRAGEESLPCSITFAQLQLAVERCCSWLVASNVTDGRRDGEAYPNPVGVLLGSDITIFIYIAALLRIGTPVLSLSARLTSKAIAHLLQATSANTVIQDQHVARLSKEVGQQSDHIRLVNALNFEDFLKPNHLGHCGLPVPPSYIHRVRHELGAIIMHSSGTTGLPKPIYHAPSYLLVYAACHRMPEREKPYSYNVSTLPLYHGFGLLAPSLALSIGLPCVLPSASIIPTARYALATLKSTNAGSMMSVPSILEDMLKMPELDALATLKTLDFIAIGGAPMKETVGAELVGNGVNLLNHWGATEIGAIALIQPIPDDYDWHYLIPRQDIGLEFQLVDASTRSYKLVGHPHGWSEPFYVQDALEMHPTSRTTQVRILGRTDDLVVLATGEKVRPTMLEQTVAEHPFVKDALAFGEGRPHLGLLVEVSRYFVDESDRGAFIESLEPYVERGNSFTDAHGKILMNMLILTFTSEKPLIRTDKGSLARKANYVTFDEEIRRCYDEFELATAFPFPKNDPSALREALRALVMESYREGTDYFVTSSGDRVDFFEVGMNSLQATRLRVSIQNSLRKTLDLPSLNLVLDFCFQNSTLEKLTSAVSVFMADEHSPTPDSKLSADGKEMLRTANMLAAFQRYAAELRGYRKQFVDATLVPYVNGINHSRNGSQGKVVVLTGSTGSLGSLLLAQLVADPTVIKVFCLNRPREGGRDAMKHQRQVMESRGVWVNEAYWEKVVFFEARMGEAGLGLDQSQYQELFSLTHIIHNAWPVDFNRSLSSFDTHLQAVCNLIQLCLRAATTGLQSTCPKRLLFASSIAVAGRYPIVHPEGPGDVPEAELEPQCTDDFGYPEAKWVCEKILLEANGLFGTSTSKNVDEDARGPLLLTSSLRIGQMTGPEGSGAWNETEHFPIIVRTSQMIKALPRVEGSLSWMPVNRTASVVIELLFSIGFRPIYHLENPSRQSWASVLDGLAAIFGSKDAPLPIIPFKDWLDRARALGEDPSYNHALKVMHFLEQDFIRMASGTVILRTAESKLDSPTLLRSTSLDKRHLEEYVAYWRKQKFLA